MGVFLQEGVEQVVGRFALMELPLCPMMVGLRVTLIAYRQFGPVEILFSVLDVSY